jgi:hypothetical protein
MALNQGQKSRIDAMIAQNKKRIDILQDLIAHHDAQARDVSDYLKENKTLQGMLKTITIRAKQIEAAGEAVERKALAKEIKSLASGAIKVLQKQAVE